VVWRKRARLRRPWRWPAARRQTARVRWNDRFDVLKMKDDVHDEVEGGL
jgi:hypothetical protein